MDLTAATLENNALATHLAYVGVMNVSAKVSLLLIENDLSLVRLLPLAVSQNGERELSGANANSGAVQRQ